MTEIGAESIRNTQVARLISEIWLRYEGLSPMEELPPWGDLYDFRYSGPNTIAFDYGTTYTGVSYAPASPSNITMFKTESHYSQNKSSKTKAHPTEVSSTRLYIGNLPRHATKEDITAHFNMHGAGVISDIKLMAGFGFIEYADPLDARDVVPAFHGTNFMGERLVVQFARSSAPPRVPKQTKDDLSRVFEIPVFIGKGRGGLWEHPSSTKALGDYCAKQNFMREDYAVKLGLTIDRQTTSDITIGNRKKVSTTGTTQASFLFEDERGTMYSQIFHLLPSCIHDVILGKAFLKVTNTFSSAANFGRRVKERFLKGITHHHLLYLGDSAPRFEGLINGRPQDALADSGAKAMVIDEDYARTIGLHIHKSKNHRTKLRFADSSTAYTSGMTYGVEWQFGPDGLEEKHLLDFHVLKNAPANVVLSDSFLFDTEAYWQYDCYLLDDDDGDDSYFFAIDVDPAQLASQDQPSMLDMDYFELVRRGEEEDRISSLPVAEQAAAWVAENERRARWELMKASLQMPPSSAASNALISNQPSSTPSPSALQQLSSSETPKKRLRWWLKLKRKDGS